MTLACRFYTNPTIHRAGKKGNSIIFLSLAQLPSDESWAGLRPTEATLYFIHLRRAPGHTGRLTDSQYVGLYTLHGWYPIVCDILLVLRQA